MLRIARSANKTSAPLVFTNSTSTTAGFNLESYAGGVLYVTATSTNGQINLTFAAKAGSGDTDAFTVASSVNAVVTITVQPGRAYALPDDLFACAWVMPVTASGTVTCLVGFKA